MIVVVVVVVVDIAYIVDRIHYTPLPMVVVVVVSQVVDQVHSTLYNVSSSIKCRSDTL